ncbi:MAG: hypothetical protein SV377_05080 [Halobacteria archaeon]|nr:hypothetical protein [Halobacteria archaeon]
MAETPTASEKKEAHTRGIKVTAFSTLLGLLAGIISWAITEPGIVLESGLNQMYGFYLLVLFIIIQRPFLPYLGKEEMGRKDWLYVAFMTFDFWFIAWVMLLTGYPA